ncbi:MAG: hypothetical protein WBC70_07905 [Candidatus Aminicenantales bacterium]
MHRNAIAIISCLVLLLGFAPAANSQVKPANKAARIRIIRSSVEPELAGREAPGGKAYLVLETEWENIHPKQKVKKSDLEKKPDRTMGIGGLTGKKKETKEEYVDIDVPYLIPNLFDHIYCLADGQSVSLDGATKEVPGGANPQGEFSVAKLGEKKRLSLAFLIPDGSENLAFQLFDYSNGHILVPISGDVELALGKGGAPGKALGSIKDNLIELAALKMDLRPDFEEEDAPAGWRYAVIDLGGKSLSQGGNVKNIIQIEPTAYIWTQTKDGFLYYCVGATTTEDGYVRFTPEVFQTQQLRFLVPADDKDLALGIRIQNKVYSLPLSPDFTMKLPKAFATHHDGKTMEIRVFGARREAGKVILDLGIQSLVGSGIEIQTAPQFMIEADGERIEFDESATAELLRRPPEPFIAPPQTFIRFELAYDTEAAPAYLHYRGYESEGKLALPGLK